jgi:hypothetical protein
MPDAAAFMHASSPLIDQAATFSAIRDQPDFSFALMVMHDIPSAYLRHALLPSLPRITPNNSQIQGSRQLHYYSSSPLDVCIGENDPWDRRTEACPMRRQQPQ